MARAKKVRGVGRPVGSSHTVSHAARIRKILARFGVDASPAKVKSEIARLNKICKPENRIPMDKALNVKIAQCKSGLVAAATGFKRATRGRRTNVEKQLVTAKLELAKLQVAPAEVVVEVAPVEVVVEAVAEVVVEAVAAEAAVAAA